MYVFSFTECFVQLLYWQYRYLNNTLFSLHSMLHMSHRYCHYCFTSVWFRPCPGTGADSDLLLFLKISLNLDFFSWILHFPVITTMEVDKYVLFRQHCGRPQQTHRLRFYSNTSFYKTDQSEDQQNQLYEFPVHFIS